MYNKISALDPANLRTSAMGLCPAYPSQSVESKSKSHLKDSHLKYRFVFLYAILGGRAPYLLAIK
jgi:hypothetical protein